MVLGHGSLLPGEVVTDKTVIPVRIFPRRDRNVHEAM
jgi:hypothetical protein